MWDSYDESMTLRLLDEANYDAEMESKVLPALDACMTEGWMDPATVDWNGDALPKLDEPGRLHYCCYDAHKFDVLREDGASGIFRGVVVISHGFTESRENTARWHGTSCCPAIPYASSNTAGTAIPHTT